MAVVLGDGSGVELVELLLELERARLLAHLTRVVAPNPREGKVERRRVRHVVYEDLRFAGLTVKGNVRALLMHAIHFIMPMLLEYPTIQHH